LLSELTDETLPERNATAALSRTAALKIAALARDGQFCTSRVFVEMESASIPSGGYARHCRA